MGTTNVICFLAEPQYGGLITANHPRNITRSGETPVLKTKVAAALTFAALLSGGMAAGASAHEKTNMYEDHGARQVQTFRVELDALNDSGAHGVARLRLEGDQLTIKIRANGFAPNLVHAQHIHGVGNSECPAPDSMPSMHTRADGTVQSFLSTSDGAPSYGPIVSSLTTEGDTSPAAGLAIELMPVADAKGRIRYERTITVDPEVAADITSFQIVQHGVDFNDSGDYDFDAAGPSDLAETVPQEATAPATCGTIDHRH